MSQKSIILIVVLFALLVIGMFIFAQLKKTEIENVVVTPPEETEEVTIPYPEISQIDAKHYFIDGTHTVVGEIVLPTPCDLLTTNSMVQESFPETVILDFNVVNNSDFCATVVTAQRFKIEASASEEASFRAMFMGREVSLNITPAPEGETPDDFELFIKG